MGRTKGDIRSLDDGSYRTVVGSVVQGFKV